MTIRPYICGERNTLITPLCLWAVIVLGLGAMLRFEAEGGGRGSGDLPRNCTPEPLCAGTCAQGFGGLEFWGVGSARRGPSSVMPPRSEPSLYAQLPCGGGGRGLCTGPAQFQRLRGGGGCEVSTDPGGIRAEKRGLALLVICIPTRKQ